MVVLHHRLDPEDLGVVDEEMGRTTPASTSASSLRLKKDGEQTPEPELAPVSIDEKPPAPSRQSWLLRLFESKMCDMHIAISYLFR